MVVIDRIDIPIYFVMGLKDTLIEPVSIITHFSTLEDHHPNLGTQFSEYVNGIVFN